MEIQKSGVAVLAAAAGRIMHVRDGMDDVSIRAAAKGSIADKECGNGVLIEHERGWSTQYCHMAKGGLRAHPGDRVSSGQPIALVGLSGDTEFPHVHLTVRVASGAAVEIIGITVAPFLRADQSPNYPRSGKPLAPGQFFCTIHPFRA